MPELRKSKTVRKPKAGKKVPKAVVEKNAETSSSKTEKVGPFALVLYDDGTKGVIESKNIPTNKRKIGESCSVPNPIDYGQPDGTEEDGTGTDLRQARTQHPATLIRFGSNIQYLYAQPLRGDGSLNAEDDESYPPAAKKTRAVQTQNKAKREEVKLNVESSLSKLPAFSHVVETLSNNDQTPSNKIVDIDLQNLTPKLLTQSLPSSSQSTASDQVSPTDEIEDNDSQTPTPAEPLHPSLSFSHSVASEVPTISDDKVENYSRTQTAEVLIQLAGSSPPVSINQLPPTVDDNLGVAIKIPNQLTPPPLVSINSDPSSSKFNEKSDGSSPTPHDDMFHQGDYDYLDLSDISRQETVSSTKTPGISPPTCPIYEVLNEASSENLLFMRLFQNPSNINFLSKLSTAVSAHMPENTIGCPPAESACPIVNCPPASVVNDSSRGPKRVRVKVKLSDLECSEPGPNKFHLVTGVPVYLPKHQIMSLLPMVGSDAAKEAANTTTPIKMVAHLLDLLVPPEIQRSTSYSYLPEDVVKAIQAYINMRLPESSKLGQDDFATAITNRCRSGLRDREGEAIRRQENLNNGVIPKKRVRKIKKEVPTTLKNVILVQQEDGTFVNVFVTP